MPGPITSALTKRRWWVRVLLAVAVLFLVAGPAGLYISLARPVFHKDIINKYAGVYKFDPLFIMAMVRVESSFFHTARSPRGARGLMQLMPVTALEMADKVGMKIVLDDLHDPETNIHLGIHYLYLLRNEFKTDSVAILAAYNAGPNNARLWMKNGALTIDEITFAETRYFVEHVLQTYNWLKRVQKIKNVFAPPGNAVK